MDMDEHYYDVADTMLRDSFENEIMIEEKFRVLGQSIEMEYFGHKFKDISEKEEELSKIHLLSCVLLECLIIAGVIYFNSYSLILSLLTIDSAFSTIKHIALYHSLPIKAGITSTELYRRFSYYSLVLFFSKSIKLMSWGSINIDWLIPVCVASHILSHLVKKFPFSGYISFLEREYKKMVCALLSRMMSSIVNTISKYSLGYHPHVHHEELTPFVLKIVKKKGGGTHLVQFIESFIFASLIHYAEVSGYSFYTRIYRRYYVKKDKKTKNFDDSKYAMYILKNRLWDQLLEINTVGVFLRLYLEQSKDKQYSIKHVLRKWFLKAAKSYAQIMSCWTVGVLLKFAPLAALTSCLFLGRETFSKRHFIIIPIGMLAGFYTGNSLLAALISELTNGLVFNKISQAVIQDVYKKLSHDEFTRSYISVFWLSVFYALATVFIKEMNMYMNMYLVFVCGWRINI